MLIAYNCFGYCYCDTGYQSACPPHRLMKNAPQLTKLFDVGESVELPCQQGFVPAGNRSVECLKNGSWSNVLGECKSMC